MEYTSLPKFVTRQQLDSAPLSFAQQRLWFLDQLNSESQIHNISVAIHFNGFLDVTALEQSLSEILQRHDGLRTTFTSVDGQPLQVITKDSNWTLQTVDLREFDETERQQESRRLIADSVRQPFDLATGPLLRAVWQRLGEIEHILLLTIHEIVGDKWSLGLLLQELGTLYQAFSQGNPSPLVEVPIQYADFAIWQRECVQNQVWASQQAYWQQQLGGELPVLELPTDHPRPPVQTYRGARQSLNLSTDLTNALKSLSQESGVTLFTTLLTVFKILLYRYTNIEDIIVGSIVANRNQAEVEGLIGLFANSLVMRTDLSGNPTFQELLGRVQDVVLSASSHQDLPFEKLVEELQTERNSSRSPLFQVMFILESEQEIRWEFPGLNLNVVEVENNSTKFDLTVEVKETSDGINGWFEYNADLFNADTIGRMIDHWQVLLAGVVAQPNQQISHLPILTEAQSHQLLVEWNDVDADYPKNVCLHQLVERQVEKTPDAVAIIFENQQLTYKELNCRANQFAHYLQGLGVEPQTPVAIFMELSMDVAVAILGITKAGGVLVPLDIKYPKERLAFILEETQAPVLLTQQRLLTELPPYQGDMVCVDTIRQTLRQQSLENPDREVKPENLAYILYTSGSTGKPKGVMLSHFVCCNRELWEQRTYPMTAKDRILLKSAWSSKEFFWPLLAGATVVMTRPGGYQDPNYLVNLIAKQKITVISVVPTVLKFMLEERDIENCRDLRHIFCVGEAMPVQLQDSFFKRGLTGNLYNLYGLNEVNYATVWQCQMNYKQSFVPIGRPTDMQIYLLDQYLQPVPIGVIGEIYISGVGLASGYFKRSQLTQERFISNPFIEDLEARLFKTGDLARYLPDGVIQYIGRSDHQVKIRGNRTELGEIEAALRQHPSVKVAAVIMREEIPGEKRLVAYFTLNLERTVKVDQLRRFLQQKLPDYMVPSNFLPLEVMPLTFNGKIDRIALAKLENPQTSSERNFVAPRTPIEQRLTNIWMEVLNLKSVSIHDNFFELGGNSLSLTKVMHQVSEAFQIRLNLRDLYEIPTVIELAERVEILCWHVNDSSEVSSLTREEIIL